MSAPRASTPSKSRWPSFFVLAFLAAFTLSACALFPHLGFGGPRPTIAPPTLDLANLSVEQRAAVLALSAQPLFISDAVGDGGIVPYNENAIGQANWYQVASGRGGGVTLVTVRLGWGDCQSGCIYEHRWAYTVVNDAITGVAESGVTMPSFTFGPGGNSNLTISASAGPTCPVERVPPDPACADRPVADALVTANPLAGNSVSGHTDATGTVALDVPAGIYLLTGSSSTVGFTDSTSAGVILAVGANGVARIAFSFDTGIR